MFKEKIEKLKEKLNENGDKKRIENLIVFVVILVVTILVINTIWKDNDEEKDENVSSYKRLAVEEEKEEENDDLEKRLEQILEKMEGVGKVSVMITYSQGSEVVPMQNETSKTSTVNETDSDGGTRITEQIDSSKEIIYSDGNKIETQMVKNPVAKGAIIIAEGASNAVVKTNIVSAVEAITGLATYKVQVFEMN